MSLRQPLETFQLATLLFVLMFMPRLSCSYNNWSTISRHYQYILLHAGYILSKIPSGLHAYVSKCCVQSLSYCPQLTGNECFSIYWAHCRADRCLGYTHTVMDTSSNVLICLWHRMYRQLVLSGLGRLIGAKNCNKSDWEDLWVALADCSSETYVVTILCSVQRGRSFSLDENYVSVAYCLYVIFVSGSIPLMYSTILL